MLAVAGLLLSAPGYAGQAATASMQEGEYLTRAAGCFGCHTDSKAGGKPYAGGRALQTPFGRFYSPNITADKREGIGAWSDEDFVRALREGLRPDGTHYFPVFPYTSYSKMTREDMLAIKSYLFSLPAIDQKNKAHDISPPFSWRWLQAGWKLLFFNNAEASIPKNKSKAWLRGRYLVDAVVHCGECHTPRNMFGGLRQDAYLSGTSAGPEGELVANITPDNSTGIGDWTKGDIVTLLKEGLLPDFDNVQGSMEEVITNSLAHLSDDDLNAISEYLLSVPAVENKIERKSP